MRPRRFAIRPPGLSHPIAFAVLGLLALLHAAPAAGLTFVGNLAPGSQLTQSSASSPLSGAVTLELGELVPPATGTPFDVVGLAAAGAGLSISLDGRLANPGLGVLASDGTFRIPSLHLSVDGSDLTVSDVAGTFVASAACGGLWCLETSFDVDPGVGGIVRIDVAAAVPEPSPFGLLAGAVAAACGSGAARRGRA